MPSCDKEVTLSAKVEPDSDRTGLVARVHTLGLLNSFLINLRLSIWYVEEWLGQEE
jgi:hypothetical protein